MRPELVELLGRGALGGELVGAQALVGGEIARKRSQHAAVELDDAGDHRVEKEAVVGDDDRRRHALEQLFEQLDAGDIEMVGRLVEQQQIGLQRKGERQCCTLAFAARGGRRIGGFVQTESLQVFGQPGLHPPALALVVEGLELAALEQTVVQGLGHRQHRLLLDRTDLQTVTTLHQAVV